jgi:hypothetical protein
MFAKNQIWRVTHRVNSCDNLSLSLVENEGEDSERDGDGDTFLLRPRRTKSSSDLPVTKTNISKRTTTNTKQVRFSENCRVVLIPCLKEYRSLGLHLDMWWEPKDYRLFKLSASQEVSNFLNSFGGDVKSIMRQLYQPDSAKVGLMGTEL